MNRLQAFRAARHRSGGAPAQYGLEFGTAHNSDYLSTTTVPNIFTGILLVCKARNDNPVTYTYTTPNKYCASFLHANGDPLWCITGNQQNVVDDLHGYFNQNITTVVGDKLGWIGAQVPNAECLDWTFNAWQFIYSGITATDTVTWRQWFRFGWMSPYLEKETIMTVAAIRTALANPAWVPTAVSTMALGAALQVGSGNSNQFSMTDVTIYEYGTKPTQAELTDILRGTNPAGYPTPWGKFPLKWENGAANIADTSGNNRVLTVNGSILQGQESSEAMRTTGLYIRQSSPWYNSPGVASVAMAFESPVLNTHSALTVEATSTGSANVTLSDSVLNSYTMLSAHNSWNRYAVIAAAPSSTAGVVSVTLAAVTGTSDFGGQVHEWGNADSVNLVDWSVKNEVETGLLQILAPQANSKAGVVVSTIENPAGSYNDAAINPAGWTAFQGIGMINANNVICRKRFDTPQLVNFVTPAQAGTAPNVVGAMIAIRPIN